MPADRAARTDPRDEVRDAALGLLPDLRPGRLVVRERVVDVGVLIRFPRAVDLGDEPVGHAVVGVRVLRRHRGRADDDVGAVRLEHVALVLADLVGADEDAAIALLLRDQRQAHAGVARRRLHDGAALLECPRGLGVLDHSQGDAVLDRAARVDVLHLGQHDPRHITHDLLEPDKRGVSDEVDDRVRVAHGTQRRRWAGMSSGAGERLQRC